MMPTIATMSPRRLPFNSYCAPVPLANATMEVIMAASTNAVEKTLIAVGPPWGGKALSHIARAAGAGAAKARARYLEDFVSYPP